MQTGDLNKLNPQVVNLEIGIRNLRNISIYPLSIRDQFKISDIINSALKEFSSSERTDEILFTMFTDVVKKNLGLVFSMVALDDTNIDELLGDVTNQQVIVLANIIYQMNYEELSKKVKSLFDRMNVESPSERP